MNPTRNLAMLAAEALRGSKEERLRAVRELEALGPQAEAPLAAALSDTELVVRVAAAEALGRVGDASSARPLVEALGSRFTGGAGRGHRWKGVLWRLGMWPLCLAVAMGPLPVQIAAAAGLLYLLVQPELGYFLNRRRHDAFATAIGEALEQIARRHPSGELATVVADLEAVAGNQLQQSSEGRKAARRAARRIETLVGDRRTLPVTAGASEAEETTALPLPADAAAKPAVDHLPVPNVPAKDAEPAVVRLQAGESA